MNKILFVDDESDIDFLITSKFSQQIKSKNFHFYFARDGKQALEILESEPDIHLVFTDLNMPGMDGLTLLSEIQKLPKLIKTIVITAYGDHSNIRKAMNHGAVDFLIKPLDFNDLEITLDNTLNDINQQLELLLQKKATEENLIKLSQACEQSPAAIVITDLNGTITYVNPPCMELTGYTKEELIGQNPRILKSGAMSQEEYQILWDTITSGEKWEGDLYNKKKNGEYYWEHAIISEILDNQGNQISYVAIKQNIDLLKQHEKDLQAAKKQAEVASEAKNRFLSIMSHEFRTPLNGVLGMAGILLQQNLEDTQHEQLQIIYKSGQSLLRIIENIFQFIQIKNNELTLNNMIFDLRESIETVHSLLKPAAENKKISIVTDISEKIPSKIFGDKNNLEQVLSNLIANAIKFTKVGFIKIKVYPIESIQNRIMIQFEIIDSGIGINRDKQSEIFEHFTQADDSKTRSYNGIGLGLAIVKNIVHNLGGFIGVESEPGAGSAFWFHLPFEQEEDNRDLTEKSSNFDFHPITKAKNNQRDILIVEDDKINQIVCSRMISSQGFSSDIAQNGKIALKMMQETHYKMIFMDCLMPVMDGFETTEQIRFLETQGKLKGHTPIVALTAKALKGDREMCLSIGMDDFITKPLTLEVLQNSIDKYINSM